jgi:Fe-Mn family superoxide dismutase
VKNLNDALSGHDDLLNKDIKDLIAHLDMVPDDIRGKVRNNGGGHFNHTLFWQIMGTNAGGEPTAELMDAITTSFESFANFKDKFKTAGLGRFGSGWVWLIRNGDNLEIIDTPNQDSPVMDGKTPILGLDVWEHAYYLHYQNKRVEYIDAWWNVVNWSEVERLYQEAKNS